MGAGSSQYEASEEQSKNFENQREAKPSSSDYQIAKAVGKAKPNDNKDKAAEKIPAVKLRYSFEAIIKEADIPLDKSSIEKLQSQLQAGIFLNQRRKKFWVDGKSNNCFMLYARDLTIHWIEDGRYWKWVPLKETSGEWIDTAELLNVCWLSFSGKFEQKNLTPKTLYEVACVVMLKHSGSGWYVPVTVRLDLPDGSKQERRVNMIEKPRDQWINIPFGEFQTSPEIPGEIVFYFHGFEGGNWKSGLLIKGVKIEPKK
ncbi:hypothetical protein UlMin_009105 [Ulmus minor]